MLSKSLASSERDYYPYSMGISAGSRNKSQMRSAEIQRRTYVAQETMVEENHIKYAVANVVCKMKQKQQTQWKKFTVGAEPSSPQAKPSKIEAV